MDGALNGPMAQRSPTGEKAADARSTTRVAVIGEAMVELSAFGDDSCKVGVAGDTFNTAVYLARAGLAVDYATALGFDPLSDMIFGRIAQEGISTSMVLRAEGAPGIYAIATDAAGERSFTYWRSNSVARRYFAIEGVEAALARAASADMLYLSGITLSIFDDAGRDRLVELAAAMAGAGRPVIFDTNYRRNGWASAGEARAAIEAIAPFVSTALPTFEDEGALFGDPSPEATLARWRAAGAQDVVVKNGARGALTESHGWVAAEVIVTPRDTTGAGDSFNAAYIAARVAGCDQKTAVMRGHALAGQVIQTPGAILPRAAMPCDSRRANKG